MKDVLKNLIVEKIKGNSNQEITGQSLQDVLLSIVDSVYGDLGISMEGYLFEGIATIATIPPTLTSDSDKRFYLAVDDGIYSNFTGLQSTPIVELSILRSTSRNYWEAISLKIPLNFSIKNELGASQKDPISQAKVTDLYNEGYKYAGIAHTVDRPNPLTGEEKIFMLVTEEGDYSNYGLGDINELSIIKSDNGNWIVEGLGVNLEINDAIHTTEDSVFYVVDKDNNIIAKINNEGISTTDVKIKDENGDLKSVKELSTLIESISELYDDTLYVADSKGNVICKLGDTGLEVVNIKTNALLRNQWNNKIIATYGDSITALNGGDFTAPYSSSATNKKWAGKVAEYFNFAKLHNRGIGSTTFNYYNEAGGQVAWVKSDTGEYVSKSDAYNYDNYQGNIEIPTDCTPIRGCGSSWLRIKTMFNESFKDTVDVVLVMFHNDFHQDMQTECVWVENSVKDIEWSESEYYSQYNGDYNIESVQGGIASVIMKMQAWMPQALIILMTPISGVYINGNDDVKDLENPESKKMKRLAEVVKDIAFRMSITCIDVYGNDTINSLNKISRNYITDGIHPYSDAGAKVIARAIISKLISEIPNL